MEWQKCLLILALLCTFTQAGQLTYAGLWGDWTQPEMAPDNFYLCGAQLQVEGDQGKGDDTAVNGVNFIFCNRENW